MSRIALDAGHGMSNRSPGVYDPGNRGNGQDEHVMARGMTRRIGADLKALGHSILYTGGALGGRDDTAKRWGCDAFISFHTNAFNGRASGVEAFLYGNPTPSAKRIGAFLCANISKTLGIPNRGVKTKAFAVLRANRTDVLLEMFFQDSPDYAKYQKNVDAVELAILNAILAGLGKKTVTRLPRIPAAKPVAKVVPKYQALAVIDEQDVAQYRAFAVSHGDEISFTKL